MATTVTYDKIYAPRVTLTKEDTGAFLAVVEVDGIEPTRLETAEERAAGILTLNPPTVRAPVRQNPYDSHRILIDGCCRAVQSAISSTTGETGGPAALMMGHMRVSFAVRRALRLLGEEI